ncbi:hypothetical protein PE066_05135 [Ramlibacter tataouinensis]|uniref:hypothetical protein n=1 Tax=Ramlibacter tataouinensis TaxID=94132 RepID=UPI0022F39EC0|nr:hypothetical protein [Ramlibacter tataouinensis]WBY02923.1 hypothetical protein PE066_05135 [Ramlibacter tataouinensis]
MKILQELTLEEDVRFDPMPSSPRFPASGLNDRIRAKTANSASAADRLQPLQSSLFLLAAMSGS